MLRYAVIFLVIALIAGIFGFSGIAGAVRAGSVVVAGNLPSKDGKYSLYCAVIVKKVDEKTRGKTSLNELLRTAD